MIVKVCGMRDPQNIRAVEALGIDMMGFIFHPQSKRFVGDGPRYLPAGCKRVGVFVNHAPGFVLATCRRLGLDYAQLHGSELPEQCAALRQDGLKVIKAISVGGASSIDLAKEYDGVVDMLLFDTATAGYGGSGRAFDWSHLGLYQGSTPYMLSGGIGPDSAEAILRLDDERMAGIDLNSAFETAPALKDVNRLQEFIKKIKK